MTATTLQRKIDRLFWRAGFGASPTERKKWERAGLEAAINSLLHPPTKNVLVGTAPKAEIDGVNHPVPLQPQTQYYHDVVWWLDRMVRTRAPLVERMTLNLHDHFATSNAVVGSQPLMLAQNGTLRKHALGNFGTLTKAMMHDHAMQTFLDLIGSNAAAPNENFARELMELFTLGSGYTENDIREAARALTGFTYDYNTKKYGFSAGAHDNRSKKIFGHRGNFKPDDVIQLCLAHKAHAPFITKKLWSYFVPTAPSRSTVNALVRAYTSSHHELKPVLKVIFHSPAFYTNLTNPDMIKPPAVYLAGAMRSAHMPITTRGWASELDRMGQLLFNPPNVGGWEQGEAFLSTMTFKARSETISGILARQDFADDSVPQHESSTASLAWALAHSGQPYMRPETTAQLKRIAAKYKLRGDDDRHTPAARRRLLRQLILAGPDAQVH